MHWKGGNYFTCCNSCSNFLHSFSFLLSSEDDTFFPCLPESSFRFMISASLFTAWIFLRRSSASCFWSCSLVWLKSDLLFWSCSISEKFRVMVQIFCRVCRQHGLAKKAGKGLFISNQVNNTRWLILNDCISFSLILHRLIIVFLMGEMNSELVVFVGIKHLSWNVFTSGITPTWEWILYA